MAGLRQGFCAEVRPAGQEALARPRWVNSVQRDSASEIPQAPAKLPRGSGLETEGCAGLREADGSIVQATGTLGGKTEEEREWLSLGRQAWVSLVHC